MKKQTKIIIWSTNQKLLLNEKAFNSITVQTICKEAQVHRPPFYRLFTGKN